jgi:hypothetical protein
VLSHSNQKRKSQRQVPASERLNAFLAWWSDESACQFMQVRRCINDRQLLATLEGESLGNRQVELLDVRKEERECRRIEQADSYQGKKKEALA